MKNLLLNRIIPDLCRDPRNPITGGVCSDYFVNKCWEDAIYLRWIAKSIESGKLHLPLSDRYIGLCKGVVNELNIQIIKLEK